METVSEYITDPLQRGLVSVGVNTPGKTAAAVFLLTEAAQFWIKPDLTFDRSTGGLRPWSLLAGSGPNATPTPHYVVSGVTALILSLII